MDWGKVVDLGGTVAVVAMFIWFLANHMSKVTKSLNSVCKTLSQLSARVDECPKRRDQPRR